MAYLGNGIYDLLDVVRASKNPQINYEGLYQDAPSNIATSNLFQAMQPGYEYRNSNFINNLIDKSGFDLSGNVPIDFNRQVDFKNYFNNEPLRSNYESLARFQNFNPRVGNITPLVKNTDPLNVNEGIMPQNFEFLSSAYEDENEDDQQVAQIQGPEKRGLAALLDYLPFGEKSLLGYLGDKILPKDSPEIRSMKNFYRSQYGLTDTGQVASGIMAGYNPVSGGLLNMLTGGRFGEPTRFGLANAARQRIENIAKRRAPQTDASRAKIQELQKIAEADTISRARQANQDVYSRAEANKALGPGGGFSTSGREGAFSSKSGRGRQDF
jgi:hypothetical protein